MAVFQCKMCGGALDINEGQNIAICPYCGSKQTIPKLSNDKVTKILERANTLRLNGEYDKAIDEYQKILEVNDVVDAEIYWNLVLCKYGVVYVDDNLSGKKIPTVNRTQMTSVLIDEDYQKTIEYADPTTRQLYEEEARKIDDIQQGILAISRNEDPFDVFICYKETDETGNRTRDSLAANEIYHYLTDEGYKVFFSRITLEDKVGKYEPYIFAALNSAKIMIVLGSKKEYFEAPWVKNEWMRYINIMRKEQGRSTRNLIPCYKDMDPYDLPKEFSYYQAQDMNKLGFIPDLIRGIKKIIPKNDMQQQMAQMQQMPMQGQAQGMMGSATAVIKKAKIFIEQRDYENAKKNLDVAFDLDPENWEIYLCNLLMDYNLGNEIELKNLNNTFDSNFNYKKIIQFADEQTANRIKGYNDFIIDRLAEENAGQLYKNADDLAQFKSDNDKLYDAHNLYARISKYKDASDKSKKCIELIYSNIINDLDNTIDINKLQKAKADLAYIKEEMDTASIEDSLSKKVVYVQALGVKNSPFATIQAVDEQIKLLNNIRDFDGVSQLIYDLENKKIQIDRNVKKAKRITFLTGFAAVFVVAILVMISIVIGTFAANGVKSVTASSGPNKGRKVYIYRKDGQDVQEGSIKIGGDEIPIIGGILARDAWFTSGDNWYYHDIHGNQVSDGIYTIGSSKYAFKSSGEAVRGAFYDGSYFGEDGKQVSNELYILDGKMYYFDKDGKKAKGEYAVGDDLALVGTQSIKGKDGVIREYDFGIDGYMKISDWGQVGDRFVYYDENGVKVKNKAEEINGKYYNFDEKGYLITNKWIDQKYYAKSDGALAQNEFVNISGKVYYFKPDTTVARNSAEAGGLKLNSDGSVLSGEEFEGKFYVNGKPHNGEYGGKFYTDGYMKRNAWAGDYYIGSNGIPLTNQWVNGKKYYVGPDGRYLRSTIQMVDGKQYEFDASGIATELTTWKAPEEIGEDGGAGGGNEITTVGVSLKLSSSYSSTVNGVKISYVKVNSVVATNNDYNDIANKLKRIISEAEEEVIEELEDIARSTPKPQEIKLTKYVVSNCTRKKATVKATFSVKKSNGKMLSNKNATISVDIDANMYTLKMPSIKLD